MRLFGSKSQPIFAVPKATFCPFNPKSSRKRLRERISLTIAIQIGIRHPVCIWWLPAFVTSAHAGESHESRCSDSSGDLMVGRLSTSEFVSQNSVAGFDDLVRNRNRSLPCQKQLFAHLIRNRPERGLESVFL